MFRQIYGTYRYSYQSGFQKHYSTDTCLSYLTINIQSGFEKGYLTGIILVDPQNGFDTIGYVILSDKMTMFGFSSSTAVWFTSIS